MAEEQNARPRMSPSQRARAEARTREAMKAKGTVSQLWKEVTGLPWSEAKKLGYSDGSAKTNLELRKKLVSGKITKKDIEKAQGVAKEQAAPAPKKMASRPASKAEASKAELKMPKKTVADKMDKEVAESKASPTKAALRKKIRAEKKAKGKGAKVERLQARLNRLQGK